MLISNWMVKGIQICAFLKEKDIVYVPKLKRISNKKNFLIILLRAKIYFSKISRIDDPYDK